MNIIRVNIKSILIVVMDAKLLVLIIGLISLSKTTN